MSDKSFQSATALFAINSKTDADNLLLILKPTGGVMLADLNAAAEIREAFAGKRPEAGYSMMSIRFGSTRG